MQSVKMNRLDLLGIVQSNKENHIASYFSEIERYKTDVIAVTQHNMNLASSRDVGMIERMQPLPPIPKMFENNYILAIQMLESSVEEVVELSQEEYKQLVLDIWS